MTQNDSELDPRTVDTSRRRFLAVAGALGFGAVGTAFAPDAIRTHTQTAQAQAQHEHEVARASQEETSWAEMDKMHEEGILRFPAETQGLGGQPLAYEVDGDVKVFRLTAAITPWEWDTGQWVDAWTYNGVVPGPEIRVTEGDKVRVIVTNELPESTAVHWHGLIVPNDQDGVPFITQPPVKPGESYTYEFTVPNAGSHMYHSHHNAAEQVNRGLLGALIVEPADPTDEPAHDRDYLYILNDALGGFTINGKGFPATDAYVADFGERVRFRFMNEGNMVHPIHLHGLTFEVFARDGYPLPQPFLCDTITVAPGERWDVTVVADNPGTWAFHCHILTHAESPHGMFGMVSAFVVSEEDA